MTTHPIIQALTDKIIAELTPIDREAAFDAMLNECYDFSKVGGPFAYMRPSDVLRECDPTAHRCGVNDYADGEPWVEIEGDTYDQKEVEAIVEDFKSDLEAELSELGEELEELLQDDDYKPDTDEERDMRGSIQIKQDEIEAIEKDDFFN